MDSTQSGALDPGGMSLDQLRELRSRLQQEDDVVSYARRVAQARVDLVRAEAHRRGRSDAHEFLSGELRDVLSSHLTSGTGGVPPRPPRPVENLDDHALINELDALCAEQGFSRLDDLTADELATLEAALLGFEQRVSEQRRERFERLDALSAELVRRYREGEATVDGLLES